ncbi:MAG TPA: NIPSNAP family protein [Steroidobacteraceae bacterium]
MYTLCIRYVLDPNRAGHFRAYVENEQTVIQRSGGSIVGYWVPTDFAGPNHIGYGLIDFATLSDYEKYRKTLAEDHDHQHNAAVLEKSGAVLSMERSLIARVESKR